MKLSANDEFDLDEEVVVKKEDDVKRVGVSFSVEQIITDPTYMKFLTPTLKPRIPLYVMLELEEAETIIENEEFRIITEKGFIQMVLRYANKIREFNEDK